MILSHLGIFGDRKGRNLNIFLKYGVSVCGRVLLWWRCPLVAYVPDSGPAGPAGGWLWSSGGALPAFCPLYCIVLVVSLANMALFRVLRGFLARFGVRMYVYMGLVLCLDCVAFVRVRCLAVWRLVACLPLFCPLLSSFLSSILSSILSYCSCVCLSFCPLCSCFYLFSCFPRLVLLDAWLLILVLSFLFVGCCCFLFPCGCMGKRKGAKCCSLRPLSVFCSVVQILVTLSKNSVAVALAFSSSSGLYSQLIQQESEGLPVLTLIRSGIMSI